MPAHCRLQHLTSRSDGSSRNSIDSTAVTHEDDVELGHVRHANSNSRVYTDKPATHVTVTTRKPSLEEHSDDDQSIPFLRQLGQPQRWDAEHTTFSIRPGGATRSRGCCPWGQSPRQTSQQGQRFSFRGRIFRLVKLSIMFLGFVQLLSLLLGLLLAFFPGRMNGFYHIWNRPKDEGWSTHWPTDYTADILPVRCHSHNDYWRKIPLVSAVKAGCTGVEADVWLYNDELYVGHTSSSLTANRTFRSLYVNPLVKMLDRQNPITDFQHELRSPRNGVFDVDADQSLVLLIDFKTNGPELWPFVQAQLEPLRARNYLSYFNGKELVPGPITVVATGNAPFDKVIANMTYRDMFFDAPLAELANIPADPPARSFDYDPTEEKAYLRKISDVPPSQIQTDKGQGYSGLAPASPSIYTKYNSYYASTSLSATIGLPFPYITPQQRAKIEAQIRGAHVQGLQVRYWSIPDWPVSWRNYLWRELIVMGIDYLNVDDLKAATKGAWKSEGNYGRGIWGDGSW